MLELTDGEKTFVCVQMQPAAALTVLKSVNPLKSYLALFPLLVSKRGWTETKIRTHMRLLLRYCGQHPRACWAVT